MPPTEIRSKQIKDGQVMRSDLNITQSGEALIRRLIAGTNISISSTGVDTGTGDVTVSVSSTPNFTTLSINGTQVFDSSRNLSNIVTLTATTGRFGDGSAGSPAISFANDTDTGLYRLGTNQTALVAGARIMHHYWGDNKTVGMNWNFIKNAVVWPNVYDGTRPSIQNAFLNSGDMLVNLVQRGGTVDVDNGLGAISEIEVRRTGVSTSTVTNGGSGYAVGNVLTILGGNNNATVTVASVDGSGKVLTVTITNAGSGYNSGDNLACSGGSGTGCTFYIKNVSGSSRTAYSGHSNLTSGKIFQINPNGIYWTGVSASNPVRITIDFGSLGAMHIYRLLLVPGGRNQMPINFRVEVYTNDSYYGLDRWHLVNNTTGDNAVYLKLIELGISESLRKIRLTVFESGDNDHSGVFNIQNLIGYERYIGSGRFQGYNLSACGDTAYGDYTFNGNLTTSGNITQAGTNLNHIINSTSATTNSYLGFQRSGTLKGVVGNSWASNNLINGSVQDDMCIRNSRDILFSCNSGTNLHARLTSTEFMLGENIVYGATGQLGITTQINIEDKQGTIHLIDVVGGIITSWITV